LIPVCAQFCNKRVAGTQKLKMKLHCAIPPITFQIALHLVKSCFLQNLRMHNFPFLFNFLDLRKISKIFKTIKIMGKCFELEKLWGAPCPVELSQNSRAFRDGQKHIPRLNEKTLFAIDSFRPLRRLDVGKRVILRRWLV